MLESREFVLDIMFNRKQPYIARVDKSADVAEEFGAAAKEQIERVKHGKRAHKMQTAN